MKPRALILMVLSAGTFSCNSSTTTTDSGSDAGYRLGGTVTGASGSLVLADGAESLTLAGNGNFTFAKTLASNANYNVTVTTPPTGQTCVVAHGSGTISNANVTSVAVTCQAATLPKYTLSATVNGLDANGTVQLSDGIEQLAVSTNGVATFPTSLPNATSYNVTVTGQPRGQTCSVASPAGTVQSANVTAPVVSCVANKYLLGGTLSGLADQGNIVLANQGNQITVAANGNFLFDKPVAYDSNFVVTIARQPRGQSCDIESGTGTMGNANAISVAVSCTNNLYVVGGGVSGLAANENVILINNGSETLLVASNGTFNFTNLVAYQDSYSVAVDTQPVGQTCTVTLGDGTVADANVTSALVACSNNAYTLGGTLSGLAANGNVQLTNGSDAINVAQNGNFTFDQPVLYQSTYNVSVSGQPRGQSCEATANSGTMQDGNVNTVLATCSNNPYTVGGVVSGLLANSNVVITNNTSDSLTLTGNGNFAFTNPVNYTGVYDVEITQQPVGQNCNVTNNAGTMDDANVTTVGLACAAKSYTVGVNVTGLSTGQNVFVSNGSESLTVSANGNTNFVAALAYRSTYSVNITGQPSNQSCSITSGGSSVSVPASNSVLTTITCVGYTVGGVVSGLNGNVTLANGTQSVTLAANGNFTFPQTYPNSTPYAVSVTSQPMAQNCNIVNGSGTIANSNAVVTVACAAQLRFANNQNAIAVLGQATANANSINGGVAANANTLSGPRGSAYVSSTGRMYVADSNNNRVLGFLSVPTTGFAPNANFVIGQSTLTATAAATTATGLNLPRTPALNGNFLMVTDSNNNRVLVYGSMPTTSNPTAASVVGQAGQSLTTRASGCTATSFNSPRQAITTATGGLVVADTNNNRVLIWSSAAAATAGGNANYVLGQSSLTTCTAATTANANTLSSPAAVFTDGTRLFVADANNNRVLIWNNLATITGNQNADVVVGQASFTTTAPATSTTGLSIPRAITVANGQLFIADSGNHRVLVFNSVPTSSGAAASSVLGQAGFTTSTTSPVNAASLSSPSGVTPTGTGLIVTDTGNNRVLVYQSN